MRLFRPEDAEAESLNHQLSKIVTSAESKAKDLLSDEEPRFRETREKSETCSKNDIFKDLKKVERELF